MSQIIAHHRPLCKRPTTHFKPVLITAHYTFQARCKQPSLHKMRLIVHMFAQSLSHHLLVHIPPRQNNTSQVCTSKDGDLAGLTADFMANFLPMRSLSPPPPAAHSTCRPLATQSGVRSDSSTRGSYRFKYGNNLKTDIEHPAQGQKGARDPDCQRMSEKEFRNPLWRHTPA